MNKKHMITLKRSQLVKMITQPTVTRLKTRCWSKVMQEINFTGNQEKKKKCNDILYYWRGERNSFRFFKRNN